MVITVTIVGVSEVMLFLIKFITNVIFISFAVGFIDLIAIIGWGL